MKTSALLATKPATQNNNKIRTEDNKPNDGERSVKGLTNVRLRITLRPLGAAASVVLASSSSSTRRFLLARSSRSSFSFSKRALAAFL